MARRAGARLVLGRVERIDADDRVLILADGSEVGYDIASLDLGSEAAPLPVSARQPQAIVDALADVGEGPVVVVGGGAAGVEVAACVRAVVGGPVRLVEARDRLMSGHAASVSERVQAELEARRVAVELGATHTAGEGHLTIWATGAHAPTLLSRSGLPVDAEGFVRVCDDLRVVGHDALFAAGDCASRQNGPDPKAGFHAIEQGKVLADNLWRTVDGWPGSPATLRSFGLRSDFLTLLNLGDGHALGTRWSLSVEGRWVRRVKDLIDRRFVERFQAR